MFCLHDVGFRPIEQGDLDSIRYLRNQPSTWEMLSNVDHITPDQQQAWYESLKTAKDRAYYTIFNVNVGDQEAPICHEGDFIGVIRTDEIDYQNRSIRVGLDIAPGKRGQGWGMKTYAALLLWLFHYRNFNRVHLAVLDSNSIGIRLYENAGFKLEGRQRQAIWRDGTWHDYLLYSILAEEYKCRH